MSEPVSKFSKYMISATAIVCGIMAVFIILLHAACGAIKLGLFIATIPVFFFVLISSIILFVDYVYKKEKF